MRVVFDEQHDRATFVIVDGQQTHETGYTEALFVTPDEAEAGVMVQLGFEQPARLLWISVEPASLALPRDVLAAATRANR
jgi:hypothetical protein